MPPAKGRRDRTMATMSFAFGCVRLKEYFHPLGFEADLQWPKSITARVFDPKTGENLALLSGLPWATVKTIDGLVKIIGALEHEMTLRE